MTFRELSQKAIISFADLSSNLWSEIFEERVKRKQGSKWCINYCDQLLYSYCDLMDYVYTGPWHGD